MNGHGNEAALLADRPTAEIARLRGRGLLFGGLGLAGTAAGLMTAEWPVFLQSYLVAYLFWLGIALGSLALLMVQYLSGGAWGLVSRRVFEAATRTLPLLAVLFVPIALNLEALFAWARPEAAADHILHEKAPYLNAPFFLIRAAGYFAIWLALTFILNRWSHQQDTGAPQPPGPKDRRLRVLSGPGLVLYVLTITFMSVDWIMSLDPHFYSTIFGVVTMGGQGLAALAFTILILAGLAGARPLSAVADPEKFHDLGKLLLAFVMLWAYFNVSQLLIIWSANLPEEVPWYIERLQGRWAPISVAILLGHFALPFLVLLSRDLKRHARLLSWVALFVLAMRVVDLVWTIGPIFRHEGTIGWLDAAVVLGMGALWLPLFFRNLAGRALVPAHDPYFKDAIAHGGH